jgi:hypothetical protein
MATRTRTSFQKRQKELARVEKQRDKAAKRAQRKLEGPKPEETDEMLLMEAGEGGGVGEDGDSQDGPSAEGEITGTSAHQEESH